MAETYRDAQNRLTGLHAQALLRMGEKFRTASRSASDRGKQLTERRRTEHHRRNTDQVFDSEPTRRQISAARATIEDRFTDASGQLTRLNREMIEEIRQTYRNGQTVTNNYWEQIPTRFNKIITAAENDFSKILDDLK